MLLAAVISISVSAAATPEALFDLGLRAFRAQDYASAVVDLNSAVRAYDPQFGAAYQTALVYLSLAQFRLGMEEAARDTIVRLVESERLYPAYATLTLGPDAADFDILVAALVPNANLSRANPVVTDDPTVALPSVRPVTPATTTPPAAIEATAEVQAEEIQEETERRIAAIQADADRRIAEIQAEADRRIAAAQAAAEQRVAAAQAAADQRVAAATGQAQRDADARIAAIERSTPQSGGQAILPVQPARPEQGTTGQAGLPVLQDLRQAESFASSGDIAAARALYVRVSTDRNAPREVLAEAGTGLYRIGSYRESVDAFRRLGVFARGEEDLRYYFAVALYESGEYREAQKELACALPFIRHTEDVERYRLKIEQTMAVNLTRQ
jgi:hypothetical protein